MNDDGQLARARQFHLLNEDSLLNFARRMVVIIVEANLSPGNDFWIS